MTTEEFLKDISDRLTAIGANVSEERIRGIVDAAVAAKLASDPAFTRKMRFGGDEALIGSKFSRWGLGAADIEFAYDLLMARKAAGGRGPSEELTKAFSEMSEAVYMSPEQVRAIDRQAIDDLFPRVTKRNRAEYQRAIRAMDTAESGFGLQLVGAQYVGELWEQARQESLVFNLLNSFEMTAPLAYLPVAAALPEMLFVGESTANNSSNYDTVKTGSNRVSVSAKKFVIHQMWSGEMEEDSIIPFVPFLRAQAAASVGYYSDSLVLNGDETNAGTGNINLDDADPADTKHYLAFDGIRHAGLVDNTANKVDMNGAITYAALLKARARMIDRTYLYDWGHPINPLDLVYVTNPETAGTIDGLEQVLTMDKYGQNATVLAGEVSRIGRHPLISTMAVPLTEADGKSSTTGGNNTKGQVVTFNRRAFVVGWRRRVKVETERLPGSDQTRIVYSLRLGMGRYTPTGAASGIEAADVIYNITV